MSTLNELYPSVPYNVLAYTPPSFLPDAGTQATPADLTAYEQLLKNLEKGINAGTYSKAIADVLKGIFIDDTINYQTYVNIGLSLITLAVPEIGIFTPFIGLFFAALNKHDAPPPPNAKDIFEAMKPAIQEMIDRTLTADEQTFLNGEISGLQNLAARYQSTMDDIQSHGGFNKVDSGLIKKFTDEVLSLNSFYTDRLPVFITDNTADRTLLGLPYYAILASMHLMLLRDIITKGPTWDSKINFTPDAIDSFKTDIKNNIKLYSKTIYDVFQKGLASYGTPSDLESFAKKQKYIEIMTTHCLDFARLFPTFDPDLYPTGSGDISLQKTRRILSPFIPIRTADGLTLNNTSIDTSNWPNYENGNGAFPNPKERILKQFKLYPSWRAGQYGGLLQPYLWAIEVQDSVETRLYGQLPAVDPQAGPNYVSIDSSNPIIQINMDTWKTPPQGASGWNTNLMRGSVSGLSFLQRDGTRLSAGMGGGFADTIYSLPATHYLSYLYGTPYQTSDNYSGHVGALVGVSTPQEATLPNIIGQPDEQGNVSTMGFPFEKASYGGTVVKEWLNGANAMKLSPGQSIGIPITNVTKQNYQVRCRYASNSDNPVFFNVDTGGANPIFQQINFESTVDSNMGVKGENGVYVVKSIATTDNSFTVKIPAKTINVHLTNQGSSDIFLDRIEFIPFKLTLSPTPITLDPMKTITASVLSATRASDGITTINDPVDGTLLSLPMGTSIDFSILNPTQTGTYQVSILYKSSSGGFTITKVTNDQNGQMVDYASTSELQYSNPIYVLSSNTGNTVLTIGPGGYSGPDLLIKEIRFTPATPNSSNKIDTDFQLVDGQGTVTIWKSDKIAYTLADIDIQISFNQTAWQSPNITPYLNDDPVGGIANFYNTTGESQHFTKDSLLFQRGFNNIRVNNGFGGATISGHMKANVIDNPS
ncbi:hypothetical protein QC456_005228 [Bacillus cereus]|nr:hypothetical protein [Bacillus cereus]